MPQPNDLSRSLATLEQDSTLIAVIEMSQASWLVTQGKRTRSATQGGAQARGRIPTAMGESRASLTTSGA